MELGKGFRISGLGFQGSEFKVKGSYRSRGSRVSGFRVSEFKGLGYAFRGERSRIIKP